jgi:hypothetical protein
MDIINIKLPAEIIVILILLLDKFSIFNLRLVNKTLMLQANYVLFKDAFKYFEIHKLIFLYAYTIPFDVIVNECPYLRAIALNLCFDDFKEDKYYSQLSKKWIFESSNFYITSERPVRLLQRMDLLDFIILSQNISASINQLKENFSFNIDFMEIMKFLLKQCTSLKTIDISSNRADINHIDERLLTNLKENIDKVNLVNYWYNSRNILNFIKSIKKVINMFFRFILSLFKTN